jgi:hypothetical protein
MFARRKKSAFKGPMLNSGFFGSSIGYYGPGHGSPAIRPREGSEGRMNIALRDGVRRGSAGGKKRRSQIIEEEEEEEVAVDFGEGEEEIEEVEAFSPVDLAKGESVQSVTVWDDPTLDDNELQMKVKGLALSLAEIDE